QTATTNGDNKRRQQTATTNGDNKRRQQNATTKGQQQKRRVHRSPFVVDSCCRRLLSKFVVDF
ncbi:MAG TPA: hypothetical protein VM100_06285, partial [Longimicrobiales bacterium]|nr:hypothetical protein [Longimicrobiales bacterium]